VPPLGDTIDGVMTEVLPGIHQLRLPLEGSPLRHTNGYLIKADDGWTLVDCGWKLPGALEALARGVEEAGARLDEIRTLVVTHFHSDHYGLAGTLVDLTRARMLMHRLDWLHIQNEMVDFDAAVERLDGWLRLNGAPPELLDEEQRRAAQMYARYDVQAPDEQVEDGHRIRVGRHELQVIWTPGHTMGHICLFDAERRVLLTGDHVLDPITPNVSLNREYAGNPLGQYLSSLRKVGELDADLVLPAHGEPFNGVSRRVRELLAHHDEREDEIVEALSHGPRTGFEIAAALPWTRRRRTLADLQLGQQRMALTETLAHLEELRETGRARRARRGDLLFYEALAPV